MRENSITIREFAKLLTGPDCSDPVKTGRDEGWLDSLNEFEAEKELTRKAAAGLIHRFLLLKRGENDENDWSSACRLKDLYECRTCVNHIAQVFEKGIIPAKVREDVLYFDMGAAITVREADRIAERIICPNKRIPPVRKGLTQKEPVPELFAEDVLLRMEQSAYVCIVDVRSTEEYEEEHLPGAVSIPMEEIVEMADRGDFSAFVREREYYFYCNMGYMSRICAGILAEAGFIHVHSFAKMVHLS